MYFAIVALFITYYVQRPISAYGMRSMKSNIEYRTSITSVLRLFREIKILNKDAFYEKKLNHLKNENSNVGAVTIWLGQIPKALLESAMLIGLLVLVVVISTPKGDVTSYGVLGIYIASATRLVPAILRMQSSLYLIRTSLPGANQALSLLSFFENSRKSIVLNMDRDLPSARPTVPSDFIKMTQISFGYDGSASGLIYENFDLSISKGERVALTGPSGSGKSTLVDLILGLLRPTKGQILIEGIANNLWIKRNPGSASYLPQDTHIIQGTILENICLGEDESEVNAERLEIALTNAMFLDVVNKLEFGLQTQISENNPLLSGGEKQRLGIARTLYTQPALIIMDEASSAMDSGLESEFLDSLKSIPQDVTVIFIAHRHNSLRNFNRVLYLNDGSIVADGTYDQVCNILPGFNHKADS
jgi:ABC-type bacteriocin/lantibiotic exporter with double-glycine peptidase domain